MIDFSKTIQQTTYPALQQFLKIHQNIDILDDPNAAPNTFTADNIKHVGTWEERHGMDQDQSNEIYAQSNPPMDQFSAIQAKTNALNNIEAMWYAAAEKHKKAEYLDKVDDNG